LGGLNLIRIAGKSEAKRANSDIAKYADNWLKESPELIKFYLPIKLCENGLKTG